MILPAFSTTTVSPTRTSLRSISSALCRLARLTVVPASSTGSRSATGVMAPRLADLHANAVQLRGRFVLLELVGDDPARRLAGGAQPLALVEAVDLQHQPVDLEIQFVQPFDQRLAMLDGGVERGKAFDHRRRRQTVAAQLGQEIHVIVRLQPFAGAHAVAEEPQTPLAQIRGSSMRMLPAVTLRVLANGGSPCAVCSSFSLTRSELVM